MNQYLKSLFLITPIYLLSGCGGGDGNWGNMNSSYSAKLTVNGKEYTCKSQKAYDACSNTSNNDCSACTPTNPSNENIITATCQTPDNGKSYLVSVEGCIIPIDKNLQTGACTSLNLRLLTGTNFTRSQILNSGASFSRAGLTVNTIAIKCA